MTTDVSSFINIVISDLKIMDRAVSYKRLICRNDDNTEKIYIEYYVEDDKAYVYLFKRTDHDIDTFCIISGKDTKSIESKDFLDGINKWNAAHPEYTLYLFNVGTNIIIRPSYVRQKLSDIINDDFDGNVLSVSKIISIDEEHNMGILVGMQNSGFGYIINYIGNQNPIQQVSIKNIMFTGKITYDELNKDIDDNIDTVGKINFTRDDMIIHDSDGSVTRLMFKEE